MTGTSRGTGQAISSMATRMANPTQTSFAMTKGVADLTVGKPA
ncbi:hypothetical protein [Streptomyces sp. NPDC060065]